jgi:hypothetical protein
MRSLPSVVEKQGIERPQCANCSRKHIAQAVVLLTMKSALLLQESINGHPKHRLLAIANLSEASEEISTLFPDISIEIRDLTVRMFYNLELMPNLMDLILRISSRVDAMEPIKEIE